MLHGDQVVRLPLTAPWLERVRSSVSELLRNEPRELRQAALLVATQLAENVLKFGRPAADSPEGSVSIGLSGDELSIASENGASPDRFRAVTEAIERVVNCQNRELLYVERLSSMLRGSDGGSLGFGLLRIVHEGAFALRCRYDEPKLTIVATRSLAVPEPFTGRRSLRT